MVEEPNGKLLIAGFGQCPFHVRAVDIAEKIANDALALDVKTFESGVEYRKWLIANRSTFQPQEKAMQHSTSPICILNKKYLGGCDDFLNWAKLHDQQVAYQISEDAQNLKAHYQQMGEMSDADVIQRCNGILDSARQGKIPGLTPEAFLEAHPIVAKLLNGKPLAISPGKQGPDGKIFHLNGEESSLYRVIEQCRIKWFSKLVLLNFGSFT